MRCLGIGEEGLDIGEVDLIVNFDTLKSPIRMIQRVGRTGRRRSGRVVCLIAEGKADVYPRYTPTMEWDTAAGHAILLAAGGNVLTLDDRQLRYGKSDFENPSFVAKGRAT